MEFQSRAMRSLVELHEVEMRAFLVTWKRFVSSGVPLPASPDDDAYSSIERLGGHVLQAARNYLVRVTEWVGRPATDLDPTEDPMQIAPRAVEFAEALLGAYRRHLALVTVAEFEPWTHRTRGGDLVSIELLLEHAVVHPMRHRIQLERMLAGTP
jgi:uncharacterized damage-inducible protein DinB